MHVRPSALVVNLAVYGLLGLIVYKIHFKRIQLTRSYFCSDISKDILCLRMSTTLGKIDSAPNARIIKDF